MAKDITKFCEEFLKLKSTNTPLVVVTLVGIRGSAPQDLGAKVIITSDGLVYGTIGGGKIEAHAINFAINDILLNAKSIQKQSHTWNLQKDIGMTCGGEVSMLFEKEASASSWNIALFGAGHVSQELTRALLRLDCQLTVIDNRQEWLDKLPKHNKLQTLLRTEMKSVIKSLPSNTFIISMTMGHSYDVPILYEALKYHFFPYIGVIGSKAKRNAMSGELKSLGLSAEKLDKMICPIGEKIGTNEPAEIAISVISELLRVRDK
jgi:xanthine dehydrogenase accessory factor